MPLRQWLLRITAYAERLLDDLEGVDWTESIKKMQRDWIGKSEGAEVDFALAGKGDVIRVFTTRPDTLFGATYMVLAPEHPLVDVVTAPEQRAAVQAYREATARKSDLQRQELEREKTGVFTGAYAKNAFTGERIPIWIADYVLATYGTGAIMAVPGHDERDFAFAKKHHLEIREVVSPDGKEHERVDAPHTGEGIMVRSGPFNGTPSEQGRRAVAEAAKKRGIGGPSVIYRLRDWLISRQRYWGTPIPIVHCEKCGAVPVPYEQLPVVLPRDVEFTGRGGSPLSHVASFVNTTCPSCGGPARRDTDTMDTFVDSSWYMYRYVDPKLEKAFMNKDLGKKWLPVQQYTGGVEHAILHLLYMRFMAKALRDLGELWFDEPALRFRYQGTIVFKGRKMSKSRGNVQTPDAYVEKYGADTLRLFMMFMGPWVDGADWDASGIEGVHRFLRRVWELAQAESQPAGPRDADVDRAVHRTIAKVTDDLQTYSFNTAVAAMMELSNALQHATGPSRDEGVATLLLLLAPFAPYMTEELWERRGGRGSVHGQSWPAFDPKVAAAKEVTIVIQIDGKVRDRITAPAGISQSAAEKRAMDSSKVKAALNGREPDRTIFVPDRLVNFVTRRPS